MARRCFHVSEEMSPSLVSDGVVRQLQSLSGFAVQEFHPPAPVGVPPKPMPADTHLSTFIAALLAVIERGVKDTRVTCKYTVGELRKRPGLVDRELRAYMQFHRQTLKTYASQVRDTLVIAINAASTTACTRSRSSRSTWGGSTNSCPLRRAAGPPSSHPSTRSNTAVHARGGGQDEQPRCSLLLVVPRS